MRDYSVFEVLLAGQLERILWMTVAQLHASQTTPGAFVSLLRLREEIGAFAAEASGNITAAAEADSLRENLADWVFDAAQFGPDPCLRRIDEPPDEVLPYVDTAQAAFVDQIRSVARDLHTRRFRLADFSDESDLRLLRQWWLWVLDENGASITFNTVIPHVITKHDTHSVGHTAFPVPVRVPYVVGLEAGREQERLDFSRSGLEPAPKSLTDNMRRARPSMLFQRRDGVRPLLDALICVADRKPNESQRGIVARTLESLNAGGMAPDRAQVKQVERQYREASARVSAYSDDLLPF